MNRNKVRVTNADQDEVWWAEHVEGDVYKSLNTTVSAAKLDIPAGYDIGPIREFLPGYPGPESNGSHKRIFWGHLLRCKETGLGGRLVVEAIVGWEGEYA